MPLFISGSPYKQKMQKYTNSKMTDFIKYFEIRPISGQTFFSYISFHAENQWQRKRTQHLKMSWMNMESFQVEYFTFLKTSSVDMKIFKIVLSNNSRISLFPSWRGSQTAHADKFYTLKGSYVLCLALVKLKVLLRQRNFCELSTNVA